MGSVVLLVMLVVSIMEMMAMAMMMAMVTESHPQAKMFHAHGRTGLPGDLPGPAHHHEEKTLLIVIITIIDITMIILDLITGCAGG